MRFLPFPNVVFASVGKLSRDIILHCLPNVIYNSTLFFIHSEVSGTRAWETSTSRAWKQSGYGAPRAHRPAIAGCDWL